MRAVLQRVSRAQVTVESRVTGSIASGLMILLGVGLRTLAAVATSMAEKCANLRIFEDEQGKMNKSLLDVKGAALVVSQFTLYGDARGSGGRVLLRRRGRTGGSAVRRILRGAAQAGVDVETGVFQTTMSVELVNEGPVTILLDSDKTF